MRDSKHIRISNEGNRPCDPEPQPEGRAETTGALLRLAEGEAYVCRAIVVARKARPRSPSLERALGIALGRLFTLASAACLGRAGAA
jgi:hypothetical protein